MPATDFLGIRGRRILVTGASSGIGAATAIALATHGAQVALVGRDPVTLEMVAGSLPGEGHVIEVFDLANTDAIPAMLTDLAQTFGPLDGLVHAAGIHSTTPLRAIKSAEIGAILEANVTSALLLAKGLRAKNVRGPSPSIVFLASAVGLVGQAGVSAYSASKGAVVTLTKSLALELAREGIRVNCLCPGIVTTPMTERLHERIGSDAFQRVTDAHPLGLGEPGDVANAALFLLSDAARWITGTALSVDGGYTAQ